MVTLNEEQKKRITDAIAEVELQSTGEIVPVVFGRSDHYPESRWRWAVTVALLGAFGLALHDPLITPLHLLLAQFPLLALGYLIGGIRRLQRLFVTQARMDEEVHQRALDSFYRFGLHETRDRTGVLVFVSLMERRVIVLADSGIHHKAGTDPWKPVVDGLIAEIRAGNLASGLASAVLKCGDYLKRHFPAQPGQQNPNELHDLVIVRDI